MKANSFPEGISDAWEELKKDLTDSDDRQFYGISKCVNDRIEYFAGMTKRNKDEELREGFESLIIPEGKWVGTIIKDWLQNISEIGPTFRKLESGRDLDESMPFVEYFQDQAELELWVPVK